MKAILVLLSISTLWGAGPAKGKELFRSCSGCHNTETDERKMGPSLRTLYGKVNLRNGQRVNDENVREIILEGFNGMPSFRYNFRPAEIDDLIAFLRTLNAKPSVPAPSGAAWFRAWCARCHAGTSPDLRGRFTTEWIRLVTDGHAGVPPLKEWLDEPARKLLFEYLKTY